MLDSNFLKYNNLKLVMGLILITDSTNSWQKIRINNRPLNVIQFFDSHSSVEKWQ